MRLVLAGHYFANNVKTSVVINGEKSKVDLRRHEFLVPITQDLCENGVTLVFEHDSPQLRDDSEQPDHRKGLAYKLAFAYYDFVW